MPDLDTVFITAHRGNIRRYQRLLRTHLTDLERSFVLRRLNEEKSALADLLRKRAVRHAKPRTIIPGAGNGISAERHVPSRSAQSPTLPG
jgi:hypothetical protein